MKQNNPNNAKYRSPNQPVLESLKLFKPKIIQAIDRTIGIQIDENEIVSARIILVKNSD